MHVTVVIRSNEKSLVVLRRNEDSARELKTSSAIPKKHALSENLQRRNFSVHSQATRNKLPFLPACIKYMMKIVDIAADGIRESAYFLINADGVLGVPLSDIVQKPAA